eukprot:COSAG04_NODE_588_length_12325_cov_114.087682_11_plen_354_part_00
MAAAAADSIHMAARNNEIDAVRSALEADPALLNAQDKIKRVPLHLAAWAGHLQITELLLGKGADPNADALDNMVPLAFAAQNGHTEVCRALLAAKADPNHANTKTGKSPLMTAASKAKLDVVKLLVESGADIKQQTRGGKTAVGFVNAKNNHADELTKLLATDDSGVVGEAAAAADGEGGARGKKRKGKKSKNRQVKVKGEKWVNPNKLREAEEAEEQQRSASAATAADMAPTPATATDAAAAAPAASSTPPAAGGADDAMQQQLDQVNAALASQPGNEMLLQLKSDIEQGMQLAAELGGGGGAAEPSGDAAEAAAQAAPTAEGSIGPRPPPKKKKKKKAPSGPALSFADELE